jgi:hypothetical protein
MPTCPVISMTNPAICPSWCSSGKNVGIAFPLNLFTQASGNAQMKIITATWIRLLLASNNRRHFIFIPTDHLGRYLPDTTQLYLLIWSLIQLPPPPPPNFPIVMFKRKKCGYCISLRFCSHKPLLMPRWK